MAKSLWSPGILDLSARGKSRLAQVKRVEWKHGKHGHKVAAWPGRAWLKLGNRALRLSPERGEKKVVKPIVRLVPVS